MRTRKERIWARIATLVLVGWLAGIGAVFAQGATQHGILVTITAAAVGSPAGNGNLVAGYNIYRCPGTCTSTGAFVKIDTSLDLTLGYLDPATDTGLTAGSTYTFAATVVDNGTPANESGFSPLSTVTVPTSGFPANPTAPSGCKASTQ